VLPDDDREEFFNWLFSYQRDLSPISSWCHVLSQRDIERAFSEVPLRTDLNGFEAAWAGAIIAEAMISSRRSYEAVSLSVCLATDTFAVARTASLYGAKTAANEIVKS
jgi:hypothetical protein